MHVFDESLDQLIQSNLEKRQFGLKNIRNVDLLNTAHQIVKKEDELTKLSKVAVSEYRAHAKYLLDA